MDSMDRVSVLKIHQQKLLSSQNAIKTSLKVGKNKTTRNQATARTNKTQRKSTFNIFSHLKEETEDELSLPAVETKDQSTTSCLVVDLLQLANSYSKAKKNEKDTRRQSNFLGDSLPRQTINPTPKLHHFGSSISSAPDVYLKKRGSIGRQPKFSSKAESIEEENMTTDFAKSWPLSPIQRFKIPTKLPKIPTNKTNDVIEEVGDFRENLAKFNRSRNFRTKELVTLEEKPAAAGIQNKCPTQNNIKNDDEVGLNLRDSQTFATDFENFQVTSDRVRSSHVETNTLKVTGKCNEVIEARKPENRFKLDSTGSEQSDLTHVTEEIVNEENNLSQAFRIRLEEESIEINKKCMKWLKGVAREQLQNPDQIFLPHLLIS